MQGLYLDLKDTYPPPPRSENVTFYFSYVALTTAPKYLTAYLFPPISKYFTFCCYFFPFFSAHFLQFITVLPPYHISSPPNRIELYILYLWGYETLPTLYIDQCKFDNFTGDPSHANKPARIRIL